MVSASDSCSRLNGSWNVTCADHVGDVGRALADAGDRGRARQHQLLRIGARHALARVFAQRVRDLVTQHGGELGIGEIELIDETRVDHDASARHAVGVELLGLLHVELPVPAGRVGAECRRRRHDALGDGGDARELRLVGVERALVARRLELGLVGLRGALRRWSRSTPASAACDRRRRRRRWWS